MKQSKNIRVPKYNIGDILLITNPREYGVVIEVRDRRKDLALSGGKYHRHPAIGNFNFIIKILNYNKKGQIYDICVMWLSKSELNCPKYLNIK